MQRTRSNYLTLLGGALMVATWPVSAPRAMAQPPAAAATAPAAVEELALTVLARDGVKSDNPSIGQLDAGTIDPLSKPKIEQDFILRNDRKAPITIGRLQPTCGCTSVILGEGTETTKTLAPGEEVKVRASVDVTRFHGPIHKAVRAYAADGTTLLATMEITATIQDPVTLSTRQIDFHQVNFGTSVSIPFDVTLSPRVLAMGNLEVISSNPDLSVMPIGDKFPPVVPPALRHYVVAITPKSAIGPVTGTLSFTLSKKAATSPDANANAKEVASDEDRLASSLQMSQVVISGEVVGKISATPKMIVFGASRQAPQKITVTGAPALMKNLKFNSLSPWVKLSPVPVPKPAKTKTVAGEAKLPTAPASAVFDLVLDTRTPAGALETQVTITASDGERLSIPILADVPGAPKAP